MCFHSEPNCARPWGCEKNKTLLLSACNSKVGKGGRQVNKSFKNDSVSVTIAALCSKHEISAKQNKGSLNHHMCLGKALSLTHQHFSSEAKRKKEGPMLYFTE